MDFPTQSERKLVELSPRMSGVSLSLALFFWGLLPLFYAEPPRLTLLVLAGILLALALFAPRVLLPLSMATHFLATVITRVVGWLSLSLAFWGVITPLALMMKLARRDPLKRRFDLQVNSYWETLDDKSTGIDELKRQY